VNRIYTKDFLSGLLFIAFGVAALLFGQSLAQGTGTRMGPGFVPRMLAWIMIGLGALIAVRAFISSTERPDRGYVRPLLLITLSVVVFGFLLERVGLIPAAAAALILSAAGGFDVRWGQVAISVVLLCAFCVGIFKYALSLPMAIIKMPF
jgi:hypothetical protein